MAGFHEEARQRCQRVDNEPTAVTGVVIALVRIRLGLDGTVDTDGVDDPLVRPPGVDLASLATGRGIAERTPLERVLHHSASASGSRPAVQPRWKTASCAVESNAAPLGS